MSLRISPCSPGQHDQQHEPGAGNRTHRRRQSAALPGRRPAGQLAVVACTGADVVGDGKGRRHTQVTRRRPAGAGAVFYKVGHHGSHNGTARGKGLELMQRADLTRVHPRRPRRRAHPQSQGLLAHACAVACIGDCSRSARAGSCGPTWDGQTTRPTPQTSRSKRGCQRTCDEERVGEMEAVAGRGEQRSHRERVHRRCLVVR